MIEGLLVAVVVVVLAAGVAKLIERDRSAVRGAPPVPPGPTAGPGGVAGGLEGAASPASDPNAPVPAPLGAAAGPTPEPPNPVEQAAAARAGDFDRRLLAGDAEGVVADADAALAALGPAQAAERIALQLWSAAACVAAFRPSAAVERYADALAAVEGGGRVGLAGPWVDAARYDLAVVLLELGRSREADAELARIVADRGEVGAGDVSARLGELAFRLGRLDVAARQLDAAADAHRLRIGDAWLDLHRAMVARAAGRPDEAAARLDDVRSRSQQRGRSVPGATLSRAIGVRTLLALDAGDLDGALVHLGAARRAAPSVDRSLAAWLELVEGEVELASGAAAAACARAIGLAERFGAAGLVPDEAESLALAGRAALADGRADEGRELLRLAVERFERLGYRRQREALAPLLDG